MRSPLEFYFRRTCLAVILLCVFHCMNWTLFAATPQVGDKAPDFSLKTLDNRSISLSDISSKEDVVLVVLRGWPGYQCPVCTAQVQDYISASGEFAEAGARVLMVYPGPSADLKAHATEFLNNKQWPKEFLYVIDPDYTMVEAYGLRWAAPRETAYPSTFLIGRQGTVRFVRISKSHGGRTKASEVLAELRRLSSP